MTLLDIDTALNALGTPGRRALLEQIAVRPQRVTDVLTSADGARNTIKGYIHDLVESGLIERADGRLHIRPLALAELRIYFDRLWVEASLGDTWLQERRARLHDFGV